MIKKLIFIIVLIYPQFVNAQNNHFNEGKKYFDKKEYENAKFKFEQDIVFNPKSENSYLYLARIFNAKDDTELEELNLNTVMLLNPSNEYAIFQLALLNIKKSNYSEASKLIKEFDSFCKKLCIQKNELKVKLNDSLKK